MPNLLNYSIETNIIPLELDNMRLRSKFYLVNKELGNKIRRLRLLKSINAKTFAEQIGILDTSLSKIEREGTNSLQTLLKIAEVLGVNASYLLPQKKKDTLKKPPSNYLPATKSDVQELQQSIKKILKELIQLREDCKEEKSNAKKKGKKNKAQQPRK